ncbi:MAG: hypothetical protein V3V78_03960 [Candidatus Woesearchaeota archaeon]
MSPAYASEKALANKLNACNYKTIPLVDVNNLHSAHNAKFNYALQDREYQGRVAEQVKQEEEIRYKKPNVEDILNQSQLYQN